MINIALESEMGHIFWDNFFKARLFWDGRSNSHKVKHRTVKRIELKTMLEVISEMGSKMLAIRVIIF